MQHETFVDVADGYRIWVEADEASDLSPLLLLMGALGPTLVAAFFFLLPG